MKARSISMAKQDLPAAIAAAIDIALRFRREDRWESLGGLPRRLS